MVFWWVGTCGCCVLHIVAYLMACWDGRCWLRCSFQVLCGYEFGCLLFEYDLMWWCRLRCLLLYGFGLAF